MLLLKKMSKRLKNLRKPNKTKRKQEGKDTFFYYRKTGKNAVFLAV